MARCIAFLLLAVIAAQADPVFETITKRIMVKFEHELVGAKDRAKVEDEENRTIEAIRDRFVLHINGCGTAKKKGFCTQLARAFDPKYEKDVHFQECVAEMLAWSGKQGVKTLERIYRKSSKREDVRKLVATALGKTRDLESLLVIRRMIKREESPEVLCAIVEAAANFAGQTDRVREKTMKEILVRYKQLRRRAEGKPQDSLEAAIYRKVKPALDETLSSFSGKHYKRPRDWDTWIRSGGMKSSNSASSPSRQR